MAKAKKPEVWKKTLIMLVIKDAVAVEAYVSRGPTSFTQGLFPQTSLLGLNVRKGWA